MKLLDASSSFHEIYLIGERIYLLLSLQDSAVIYDVTNGLNSPLRIAEATNLNDAAYILENEIGEKVYV